jgi:hypothetical protein
LRTTKNKFIQKSKKMSLGPVWDLQQLSFPGIPL